MTKIEIFSYLIYGLLLLGGVGWLAYRFLIFSEKQRESNWDLLLKDEEFQKYADMLKQEQEAKTKASDAGSQREKPNEIPADVSSRRDTAPKRAGRPKPQRKPRDLD